MKPKRFFSKPLVLGVTAAVAAGLLGFGILNFWVYHNNPVVLEVSTDCRGLTYPRGPVLDFRLYQNGRLEYDAYPQDERTAQSHFRYWFPRTHSYITPAEVQELMNIAKQPDFLAAEREYPPAIPGLDSEFRTSISFTHAEHQKKVLVVDYLSDDGVSAKERYPPSLLALLKKVYSTRRKLS